MAMYNVYRGISSSVGATYLDTNSHISIQEGYGSSGVSYFIETSYGIDSVDRNERNKTISIEAVDDLSSTSNRTTVQDYLLNSSTRFRDAFSDSEKFDSSYELTTSGSSYGVTVGTFTTLVPAGGGDVIFVYKEKPIKNGWISTKFKINPLGVYGYLELHACRMDDPNITGGRGVGVHLILGYHNWTIREDKIGGGLNNFATGVLPSDIPNDTYVYATFSVINNNLFASYSTDGLNYTLLGGCSWTIDTTGWNLGTNRKEYAGGLFGWNNSSGEASIIRQTMDYIEVGEFAPYLSRESAIKQVLALGNGGHIAVGNDLTLEDHVWSAQLGVSYAYGNSSDVTIIGSSLGLSFGILWTNGKSYGDFYLEADCLGTEAMVQGLAFGETNNYDSIIWTNTNAISTRYSKNIIGVSRFTINNTAISQWITLPNQYNHIGMEKSGNRITFTLEGNVVGCWWGASIRDLNYNKVGLMMYGGNSGSVTFKNVRISQLGDSIDTQTVEAHTSLRYQADRYLPSGYVINNSGVTKSVFRMGTSQSIYTIGQTDYINNIEVSQSYSYADTLDRLSGDAIDITQKSGLSLVQSYANFTKSGYITDSDISLNSIALQTIKAQQSDQNKSMYNVNINTNARPTLQVGDIINTTITETNGVTSLIINSISRSYDTGGNYESNITAGIYGS